MAKSTYLRNAFLNHVLNKSTYSPPANVYLSLHTADPSSGSNEVTGGSYARKVISTAAVSGGSAASNAAINFTSMPATTATHYGIYDASSGGNLLYYGQFAVPITTTAGQTLPIASGDLTISEA